jgi:hypothetical protein
METIMTPAQQHEYDHIMLLSKILVTVIVVYFLVPFLYNIYKTKFARKPKAEIKELVLNNLNYEIFNSSKLHCRLADVTNIRNGDKQSKYFITLIIETDYCDKYEIDTYVIIKASVMMDIPYILKQMYNKVKEIPTKERCIG